MKSIGYYNGKTGLLSEMTVPIMDRALYFGDGVYDFAFAYSKKIFTLEDHLDRFFHSMEMMHIQPYCSREKLKEELQRCVDLADTDEGIAVYWQTSRGCTTPRNHVFPPEGTPSTLLITVTSLHEPDYSVPLKLIAEEDTRFFHCNIKTLNLIPNVMAAEHAKEKGCQEAVLHRGEYLTECAHSSLVLLKDGVLMAPPLDELILPSISRKHLFALAEKLNIPTEVRKITMDEVWNADELMVLSTSKLCTHADTLDGKPVGMKDPESFAKLQKAYFDWVEKDTGHRMA